MIISRLENIHQYLGAHPLLAQAINYILTTDFESLPLGKHEISGTDLFAILMEYDTKNADEGILEAHKRYLDVQYVVKGEELLGYSPLTSQQADTPYVEKDDYHLFKTQFDTIYFPAGMIAILFPEDLHQPGITVKNATKVRKLVVKVRI